MAATVEFSKSFDPLAGQPPAIRHKVSA